MVFLIPVLLVIAGVAIYKEKKQRKLEKRMLKAEAADSWRSAGAKGHGAVYYNESAIDVKLHEDAEREAPPLYRRVDSARLIVPSYAATAMPARAAALS